MLCQITARLVTVCVVCLLAFNKNTHALPWMMLMCFIHIMAVLVMKLVLFQLEHKQYKQNENLCSRNASNILSSCLSLFSYVKGRLMIRRGKKQRESQRTKFLGRFCFSTIVIIEQAIMYLAIILICKNISSILWHYTN